MTPEVECCIPPGSSVKQVRPFDTDANASKSASASRHITVQMAVRQVSATGDSVVFQQCSAVPGGAACGAGR